MTQAYLVKRGGGLFKFAVKTNGENEAVIGGEGAQRNSLAGGWGGQGYGTYGSLLGKESYVPKKRVS